VKTYTGYISKSIIYSNLTSNIYKDLNIKNIIEYKNSLDNNLSAPSAVITINNTNDDVYLISAFKSTGRGSTNELTTYSLRREMSKIFNRNVFPNISSINSHWIPLSVIVNDINSSSEKKVITQNTLNDISNIILSEYVLPTSISHDIGQSDELLAS
jgi:hypothetical protein